MPQHFTYSKSRQEQCENLTKMSRTGLLILPEI